MIFPIRHEEGATRQLPYVTWALIALCLVTFTLTHSEPAEAPATPKRSLAEAAAYWRDRGYLEPAPDVLAEVSLDVAPDQREQYLDKLRSRAVDWRPEDDAAVAGEQAELDRLTRLGVGAVVPTEARENPLRTWGFVAAQPSARSLLTHPFVHDGWMVLLGNLLLLGLLGPALESRWGRGRFAVGLGLIAGGGAAAHWLLASAPQAALPLVGTAPLVAGVLGAFLMRLWSTQIHYYYFLGAARSGTFESPGWLMLPLALGIGVLQLLFTNEATAPTLWAQIGALGVALPSALALRHLQLEDDYAAGSDATELSAHPIADEGPQHNAPELLALVEDYSARGEIENACRNWIELARRFPEARVSAPILVKLAPSMLQRGQKPRAMQALRHALDPHNHGLTPGMALRIHEEQRIALPEISLLAAERALGFGELQDAKRERLEAAIAELRDSIEAQPEGPGETLASGRATVEPASEDDAADAAADALERGGVAAEPDVLPVPQIRAASVAHTPVEQPAAAPNDAAVPEPQPSPTSLRARPPMQAQPLAPSPVQSVAPTPAEVAAPSPIQPAAPAEARPGAPADVVEDTRMLACDSMPLYPDLKVVEAVPFQLDPDALLLETGNGRQVALAFANISAVAAAVVAGLGARPVLLIDLVLGWGQPGEEPLRTVRLRSDAFDPRSFCPGVTNPVAAIRLMLERIVDGSAAVGLPDPGSAVGRPFRQFDDLASYERKVLSVDR